MDAFKYQSNVDETEISAQLDDLISKRTESSAERKSHTVRKVAVASGRSDAMAEYESLIKDQLFGPAAELCGVEEQNIVSRFQGIKMLPDPEINGHCVISLQVGHLVSFKIELYPGIFVYPWKIAEMLATRIGFKNPEDRSTIEEPTLPVEVSLEISQRLRKAFWNGQLGEAAAESDIPLSERQRVFATMLTMSASRYVLGHELGHAVHHIAQTELEEEVWSRDNVNVAIERSGILDVVGKHRRREIEHNWWQEIAADVIGVKLSLQSQTETFDKLMAYTGAEYMLMLFHYLGAQGPEEYMTGSASHPSPMVRALALRGYYGNNPPTLFQMAELLGTLSRQMFFPDLVNENENNGADEGNAG